MTARLRLQPEAVGMGMTSQRVRDRLIERLRSNGIHDERVLNAIRTVPRHLFVDEALATRAYEDTALPIGHGQTISQPWVVAKMTEALFADGAQPKKVLEVGTGSGYQGAILAALGLEVYTVERIGELLRTARKRFRTLGLNVRSKHDDGRIGWPECAPFDAIAVAARPPGPRRAGHLCAARRPVFAFALGRGARQLRRPRKNRRAGHQDQPALHLSRRSAQRGHGPGTLPAHPPLRLCGIADSGPFYNRHLHHLERGGAAAGPEARRAARPLTT